MGGEVILAGQYGRSEDGGGSGACATRDLRTAPCGEEADRWSGRLYWMLWPVARRRASGGAGWRGEEQGSEAGVGKTVGSLNES